MAEETTPLRIILIIIAAIIIPVVVVGAYVVINREPNPYKGQVLSMNVYPIHRDLTEKATTEGLGGQKESYDEILVFADVRITNTAKVPLYIHDMWAIVDSPDQTSRSTAVSASDFQKVFVAYPDTRQYQKTMLPRDATIQPGQQVEGEMIFSYQMNQQEWQSATDMNIDVGFLHQNPLVMKVPK